MKLKTAWIQWMSELKGLSVPFEFKRGYLNDLRKPPSPKILRISEAAKVLRISSGNSIIS